MGGVEGDAAGAAVAARCVPGGFAAFMLPNRRIRVVFMGSDALSCPFLEALRASPFVEVVAVVTQPDSPQGRRLRVQPNAVARLARSLGISQVWTPASANDEFMLETFAGLWIDAAVVMAYGKILGSTLLSLPRLGCVNMHVSLLPRWRGAAPIQRAILAGDSSTGITAMRMDRGLDTGDVLGQIKVPILPKDTTGTIGAKLTDLGGGLLVDVLRQLDAGTLSGTPQPPDGATYAHKIANEETWLKWTLSAVENERIVRAFNPKPGAKTYIPGVAPGERGMLLKVMAADVEDLPHGMARALPGTLLEMHQKKGPLIAGGAGRALRLVEVQPEGRPRPVGGGDFANGYRAKIPIGLRFLDSPPRPAGEGSGTAAAAASPAGSPAAAVSAAPQASGKEGSPGGTA